MGTAGFYEDHIDVNQRGYFYLFEYNDTSGFYLYETKIYLGKIYL